MDIVFYVGSSWRPWNPETIAKHGEGGSEIACANMAELLAQAGHKVRVYNDWAHDCGAYPSRKFGNVEYIYHGFFNSVVGDVLISSRCPGAVDGTYGNVFKRNVFWSHDTHYYESFTKERYDKFDTILTLSNWATDYLLRHYPFMERKKFIKTSNAIDTSLYQKKIERNPNKLIYSSSPNRGLQYACQIFQQIHRQIPSTELHVYYGFANWEETLKKKKDSNELIEMRLIKGLAESTAGVYLHGRVSPVELAEAQLSSSVWLYPTKWSETYCITALEARAAGLRTVSSNLAALPEVARGILLNGDAESLIYQKEAIQATKNALDNENWSDRFEMMNEAQTHSWKEVSEQWLKILSV